MGDDGSFSLINRKSYPMTQEVGHIVAAGEESFIISRGSDNQYKFPKSKRSEALQGRIESFDRLARIRGESLKY